MPLPFEFSPEWRDEQLRSRYPFADTARPVAAGRALGNDLFLDAAIVLDGVEDRAYLTEVEVSADEITIRVGLRRNRRLAAGTFDPANPPDHLELFDDFGRPAGLLVSEASRLLRFRTWAPGLYDFRETAEFAAVVVMPLPELCLRALRTETGDLVSGEVWLYGENGVQLSLEGAADVRVDVVGDPLFRRKECATFVQPHFVRTINDIEPGVYGDWHVHYSPDLGRPRPALRIRMTGDKIIMSIAGRPADE